MEGEMLMLYKLIILYILDRVDFKMTNSQLTKFITEREYTSYWNVQTVLNELVSNKFISQETTMSQTLYGLTSEGKEILDLTYKEISKDIRDDIDIYLTNEKYSLREEVSSLADYYESTPGEYIAELKIIERNSAILELKLSVPSVQTATTVCDKWKQKNADIYAYILNTLMGDDKPSN